MATTGLNSEALAAIGQLMESKISTGNASLSTSLLGQMESLIDVKLEANNKVITEQFNIRIQELKEAQAALKSAVDNAQTTANTARLEAQDAITAAEKRVQCLIKEQGDRISNVQHGISSVTSTRSSDGANSAKRSRSTPPGSSSSVQFSNESDECDDVRVGRGLAGTFNDGTEKFRTIVLYKWPKDEAKDRRMSWGQKIRAKISEVLGFQVVGTLKAWGPSGREVVLVCGSREYAQSIVDGIRANSDEPITVENICIYLNLKKVGFELEQEKAIKCATAAVKELMGETKGAPNSAFKANRKTGDITCSLDGFLSIGKVCVRGDQVVFLTHASNCAKVKVDLAKWKDLYNLWRKPKDQLEGFE